MAKRAVIITFGGFVLFCFLFFVIGGVLGIWFVLSPYTLSLPDAFSSDSTITKSATASIAIPSDSLVRGVDVSHWQGRISWASIDTAQVAFVFIKASEGATMMDSQFEQNWQGSQQRGLIRSPYHVLSPTTDPVEQALHFMAVVEGNGGLAATDLPAALDIEPDVNAIPDTLTARTQRWLDTVEKRWGERPILYTNLYTYNIHFQSFTNPLWISQPGVSRPPVPAPWVFWQAGTSNTLQGLPKVDIDFFKGTKAALLHFAQTDTVVVRDAQ